MFIKKIRGAALTRNKTEDEMESGMGVGQNRVELEIGVE